MNPALRKYNRRRRGFTMLEVLVVLVILAILLALVTAVVRRTMERADIEKTRAIMKVAWQAIDRYQELTGDYPTSISVMIRHTTADGKTPCADAMKNLPEGIVTKSQIKDGFGNYLMYSKSGGTADRPLLYSKGANASSTDDDIYE